MNQSEKARALEALHKGPGLFVIANPWDAGSARLLAAAGFKALTTTSAGLAHAIGKRDGYGEVTRAEALENARQIAAAVDLPVAGDLENGYGHTPEDAAATIRGAAEAGLVGASIEDATGDDANPIYGLGLATERIAAAVAAARALPFPFQVVARAENFLHGRRDLDDTIRRLQAFEGAGADVLFAPGLPDMDAIRAVVGAVTKPVNVIVSAGNASMTVAELEAAGVRRISVGSSFFRRAFAAFRDAANEVMTKGTFTFAAQGMGYDELQKLMEPNG
jgi:2-methylisocitrate lyase-like PEP mutase family enzyme